MARIFIIHSSLNPAGGGERVAIEIIKLAKNMGHEVTLITTEPTDWDRIKRLIPHAVKPDRERSIFPFKVKMFGIYSRLITPLGLLGAGKYDLLINTHGDALPIVADITYMHFPMFAILEETPDAAKYSKSLFWRIYFEPYRRIVKYLSKKYAEKDVLILTNSEFSKNAIKKHVGKKALVVYPPVDVEEFLKAGDNPPNKRDDRVVACGRFTPEKRYELIIEAAEHLSDVEFAIIGARSGKVSPPYISKLRRIIEEKKLRNVKLLVDYPRSEQLRLYSTSKVFMHAMVGEHFGIAVVEGMAAGLIPVVHRSGGPWYDIIDRGKYGYGYDTVEEAVEAIEKALKNYNAMYKQVISRAKMFDRRVFAKQMGKIISKMLSY